MSIQNSYENKINIYKKIIEGLGYKIYYYY